MTSNPILVLLISSFLLKQKITLIKGIGILIGLTGACTLIFSGQNTSGFGFGSNTISGDLMVFVNALSYGVYLVLAKPLMAKYKPLTVIKWVFTFGAIFVIPIGIGEFTSINWSTMPTYIVGEVTFVVIGTTFLCLPIKYLRA